MTVPHKFVQGTRAKAKEVNENFEYHDAELDKRANISGNASKNFHVADPIEDTHAINKRYFETHAGGSAGTGKSLLEVFSTLSTKTPNGAFSLRTGELIENCDIDYPQFWEEVSQYAGTSVDVEIAPLSKYELNESLTATYTDVNDSLVQNESVPNMLNAFASKGSHISTPIPYLIMDYYHSQPVVLLNSKAVRSDYLSSSTFDQSASYTYTANVTQSAQLTLKYLACTVSIEFLISAVYV